MATDGATTCHKKFPSGICSLHIVDIPLLAFSFPLEFWSAGVQGGVGVGGSTCACVLAWTFPLTLVEHQVNSRVNENGGSKKPLGDGFPTRWPAGSPHPRAQGASRGAGHTPAGTDRAVDWRQWQPSVSDS